MRKKWEWYTKNGQIIKDIMWQLEKLAKAKTKLKRLGEPETEEEKIAKAKAEKEKEECLKKINNLKKTYPSEAKQLDKHLISLSKKRLFSLNRRKKITNVIKTS